MEALAMAVLALAASVKAAGYIVAATVVLHAWATLRARPPPKE